MARTTSLIRPSPWSEIALSGIIFARQVTPATPKPLLPWAAIIPAIIVPCDKPVSVAAALICGLGSG